MPEHLALQSSQGGGQSCVSAGQSADNVSTRALTRCHLKHYLNHEGSRPYEDLEETHQAQGNSRSRNKLGVFRAQGVPGGAGAWWTRNRESREEIQEGTEACLTRTTERPRLGTGTVALPEETVGALEGGVHLKIEAFFLFYITLSNVIDV